MDNQMLLTYVVVICSLAGWYLVLHKYFDLKSQLKVRDQKERPVVPAERPNEPVLKQEFSQTAMMPATKFLEDTEFDYEQHIPGMGPPPLSKMGFQLPPEVLAKMKKTISTPEAEVFSAPLPKPQALEIDMQKRVVCNWASIIHLSGLAIITGIPFINILIPTVIWLLKKEQHPYLAKQGREVINFQISLSFILFGFLGMGAVFVWLLPNVAAVVFAWTKTVRVIFSTGLHIPFNLFSALPFFVGCVLMVRGAIAANHGLTFKYPYTQQFLFEGEAMHAQQHSQNTTKRKEPRMNPEASPKINSRINFG